MPAAARFMRRTRPRSKKCRSICAMYADSMVTELRTLEFEKRPRAQSFMAHAEALSDAVLGVEETDLMRRRAAAALMR